MDSEGSVILESCGEHSILIQTVKDMVNVNTHTDLQSEEGGFFVVTDVQDEQQNVIEVSNEQSTVGQSDVQFSWSNLCRICANVNDHLIPIFEGEGLQHDLCNKIHKYLPICVSENDALPLQLCYHCAATLLAWHELLEGCLNAERRLLEMQDALQEKQGIEGLETSTQDATSAPNVTESLHQQQETVKDEVSGNSAVNDSDRWKTESDPVMQISTAESESTNVEEVEYIQCAQCDIVFVNMKYLIDHMNSEHEAQMHYCQYCKLVYHGKDKDFEVHISMHGSNYNKLKDATEDETLEYTNEVKKKDKNNEKSFNQDIEKPPCYTCNLCKRNFTKKCELKKHINRHSDVNPIQNSDETELVNKAKQIINDRVSYKCETCKKVIFTKRGFLRHIRVHFDKRPCKCDLCGKSYRIEQDLARHIRDVHEGLKKYACDICGRAFANKGAKDDHRRIHTGERPYACEHCPKMFRTLNSIYIHNRVHTDYKPHKCSYCGKHFRSRQRLTHHETTHTGIKAFACEICGKTFSVKGEVVRHRAIHNEEKPFDCKCGMKFGQKRYLRNHIKQHHKEASSWLLAELLGNNN
ncbi:zinc finger protein 2 homolog isoform X2 [Bombus vosnesenskii]|uniref:Zinc finger protein 2 homolog isoform X2 n=2 Tax=Pyrobombus TaxID=144703 RepID=A0A6J3JXZ6_9HYME|nr:zinc finger protein 2 homolog isoform X2 [Bombus vancouverensis nearcticus]XP_033303843.1 zinc finger protein 2 homolog isoform X2 [Bombus bifarius]XP_033345009.1 zinc finger protein 2 homolog isoform X2 [Bombus vosnesenskii]XP_050487491.1 zinc finger protein ZFP2-like isoform X2 [Bombus huntii]